MANGFEQNAYGQNYATGGGGNAGSGSGGGFFTGGASQGGSQAGNAGKLSGTQTLRPLTIRQIIDATQAHSDAEFMCDGKPISQLTFVGCVHQITSNPTNVIYMISDGTGAIEVRVWMDANTGAQKFKDVGEYQYVRVIGGIKSFQQRRYINTGHMRLVTDANEILYHKLEAIRHHQESMKETGAGGPGSGSYSNGATGDDERMKLDTKRYEEFENPIQRKIMQIVDALAESNNSESGIPISAIARKLAGSANEVTIRKNVEDLVGDGFLYTAEDEEHVLSTSSS